MLPLTAPAARAVPLHLPVSGDIGEIVESFRKYVVDSDNFHCPTCQGKVIYCSFYDENQYIIFGENTIEQIDGEIELKWFCCPRCNYYFAVCPKCSPIDDRLWYKYIKHLRSETISGIILKAYGKRYPYTFKLPPQKLYLCRFLGYDKDTDHGIAVRALRIPKGPNFKEEMQKIRDSFADEYWFEPIADFLENGVPLNPEDGEVVELGDSAQDQDKIREYIRYSCEYYLGDLDLHYLDHKRYIFSGGHDWKCMNCGKKYNGYYY